MRPSSRGIKTLLIALYASATSFDGRTPVTGLGSVVTTVLRATAGMELSTEFSVLRFESFSSSGGRMLLGILVTRGARLRCVSQSCRIAETTLPFDCQILDFTILIIQGLENTIHSSCRGIVVIMEEIWLPNAEDCEEIVQRHEPVVRVDIVELGQQLSYRLGGRI
jgi:hypothetical protein